MWPSVLPRGWLRTPQRPGAQARRLPRLSCPKFGHGSPGGSCRRRHKREQRSRQAISVNCLDKAHPFYTILHIEKSSSLPEISWRAIIIMYTWHSISRLFGLPYQHSFRPFYFLFWNIQPIGLSRLSNSFYFSLYISGILTLVIIRERTP
jgi:hypothetical protein